jgi:hypothetical protein
MKLIVVALFLVIGLQSFSQSKKDYCRLYKEGTFISVLEQKINGVDSLIYRRENGIQIESSLDDGVETVLLKSKVIWLSDTKYVLRSMTMINNDSKVLKDDIVCKIIDATEEYYIVSAYMQTGGKKQKMQLKLYVYKKN